MSQKELQQKIESYWENKDSLNLTMLICVLMLMKFLIY